MDSYSEVSNVSWFSRLRQSIKGVLVGILLFLISFPLLYWNEGRAVSQAQALKSGASSVVSVSPDRVDSANEGFLVHTHGKADSKETLSDPEFVIEAPEILLLKRSAEIYVWRENREEKKRKKIGGGEEQTVTYSYEKVWSDKPIDSSKFQKQGYENPRMMPYESKVFEAKQASVGAFFLGALVRQMTDWEDFSVNEGEPRFQAPEASLETTSSTESDQRKTEVLEEPEVRVDDKKVDPFRNVNATTKREESKRRLEAIAVEDRQRRAEHEREFEESRRTGEERWVDQKRQRFEIELAARQEKLSKFKPHQGGYFLGQNPADPQVGDFRVRFSVVRPAVVSILAQQSGQGFAPFEMANKSQLYRLSQGEKTADEMFQQLEKENAQLTWILRGLGFLFMTLGLASVFRPFVMVADVIPFFGNLLSYGVGLFSLLVAVPLTLLTIALGWFAARPLLAVALILAAGGVAYGAFRMSRSRKPA